jgi:hypothetical protein
MWSMIVSDGDHLRLSVCCAIVCKLLLITNKESVTRYLPTQPNRAILAMALQCDSVAIENGGDDFIETPQSGKQS